MARLIHHDAFPALPVTQPLDLGRVFLVLTQLLVLGGIGVFLTLAILNTVLGTPPAEPTYQPYS